MSAMDAWSGELHSDKAKSNQAASEAAQRRLLTRPDAFKTLQRRHRRLDPWPAEGRRRDGRPGSAGGAGHWPILSTTATLDQQRRQHEHCWVERRWSCASRPSKAALLGQIDAMSISIPNATEAMRALVDVFNRQFSPEFNQWAAAARRDLGQHPAGSTARTASAPSPGRRTT
jgi:hypothetical protein